MSTKLQLVNQVLVRLREDQVTTSTANTYSTLMIALINEAKREVEDHWDWLHLRTSIDVTTASGTFRYTLTNAGDRYRLLEDDRRGPPWMQVWDDTNDNQLKLAPSVAWMTAQKVITNAQNGDPIWFDINGQVGSDPQVDFHPTPNSVASIQFDLVIPQADFLTSATSDDSTEMTVPDNPVVLLAAALAKEERGEPVGSLYIRYERALYDLVEKERKMIQGGDWRGILVD